MTEHQTSSVDIVSAFMNFATLGAAWVMWLMVALAMILGALIFERIYVFSRTRVDAASMGRALVEHLGKGELSQAQSLVARGHAMEERVLSDGLQVWERGPLAAEHVMKSSLERERQRFERFLGFIGTVGANAPFVGLLGTVIGIVLSFQQLAANPKGGMAVVGPGIAEALASTAVGLAVAIPAVVAFNTLKGSVAKRVSNVDFLSGIVLANLNNEGK